MRAEATTGCLFPPAGYLSSINSRAGGFVRACKALPIYRPQALSPAAQLPPNCYPDLNQAYCFTSCGCDTILATPLPRAPADQATSAQRGPTRAAQMSLANSSRHTQPDCMKQSM